MKISEVREMSVADLKDRIAAEKANLDSMQKRKNRTKLTPYGKKSS